MAEIGKEYSCRSPSRPARPHGTTLFEHHDIYSLSSLPLKLVSPILDEIEVEGHSDTTNKFPRQFHCCS